MKLDTKEYSAKMQKTLDALQNELATVRAGRANPDVLNKVSVDYYGQPTAINAVASVSVSDARTLAIQPWDTSLLKTIERAILASDIGITPINDGKVIRLSFPQPTEERRKEMSKEIAKMGENAKVAIRNVRRDGNKSIDAEEKAKAISEDERDDAKESIQELTKKYEEMATELAKNREKDVMED